jgi:hypothetical protein
MNLIELINELIKKYSINKIALDLNVSIGTIKRWIELNKIPSQYTFDIYKLSNIEIDYSKFSSKDKDQFFTPIETVEKCYKILKDILISYNEDEKKYLYIEPSAGSGNFLKVLPKNTLAFDIEPTSSKIIKQDYLEWKPDNKKKVIVIGNPPFGLRGHLALKFINHSSFADYVAFILPQLFESDGKGVPRKRVEDFNLIYSEKIDSKFYDFTNKEIKINCIFQVWSKYHTNLKFQINQSKDDIIKVYSLSDGGSSSTTRNKKMLYKCDIYLPSTCFGENKMKYYKTFDELPNKKGYGIVFDKDKDEYLEKFKKIEWNKIAFLSTNSAYNIRKSQILKVLN